MRNFLLSSVRFPFPVYDKPDESGAPTEESAASVPGDTPGGTSEVAEAPAEPTDISKSNEPSEEAAPAEEEQPAAPTDWRDKELNRKHRQNNSFLTHVNPPY